MGEPIWSKQFEFGRNLWESAFLVSAGYAFKDYNFRWVYGSRVLWFVPIRLCVAFALEYI